MSTQKYYKNRLGFDPSEDGVDYSRNVSPAKSSPARGGSNENDYGSPMKKSRQSTPSTVVSNADTSGYEDALTQFKGNMTMWEYFVENKDREGMYRKLRKIVEKEKHPVLFGKCQECQHAII